VTGGRTTACAALLMIAAVAGAQAARAQSEPCQKEPNFTAWLAGVKAEAVADGLPASAVNAALGTVKFDPVIIKDDRAQGVFTQDFLTFAGRMVAAYRLKDGGADLKKYASTFARVEKTYGVPPPVLAAFWGLETDFGQNNGTDPALTSLATLAYDCRRPDMFRTELLAALAIVARGDLKPSEMKGSWAGELGQLQFLASRYIDYGVDFDGDGKVNLIASAPDALASAARYLQHLGWRAGEPWLTEVEVTKPLPWEQADIAIKLPASQWTAWGVTLADGKPLAADSPPASLLLPMGRNGPAFLAFANFDVYLQWNSSLVYSTTAAYFATRLAGAPPVSPGAGTVKPLSAAEVREVQMLLTRRGYDVGQIDGVIGVKTRDAVKQVQLKFGLPADSYPDAALLTKLRG
jgi:lytic murein transglycosylase